MIALSFLVGLVAVSIPVGLLHLWVRLVHLAFAKSWTFDDGEDAVISHLVFITLTLVAVAACWGIYLLGQHLLRGPLGL